MARVITIPIGPIFTSGPCRGIVHVIKSGDTLYLLGKRYHVPVSGIMYANPYVNVYNLQIGDELCIPVGHQSRPEDEMGIPQIPLRPSMPVPRQGETDNIPGGMMPGNTQIPGEMQQPGNMQMPGQMQQPGNMQMPGEMQPQRMQESVEEIVPEEFVEA